MAAAVLAAMTGLAGALAVAAATPSPSALPCLRTLKYGGALYLDTDSAVAASEVGPKVGETDPNPTHCGLPDRLAVYRHNGHLATAEVVYYVAPNQAEVFRSGGATGYPQQDLIKWLVLLLVLAIVAFAAVPAILAHVRQPPVLVGGSDDWRDDVEPKIKPDGD